MENPAPTIGYSARPSRQPQLAREWLSSEKEQVIPVFPRDHVSQLFNEDSANHEMNANKLGKPVDGDDLSVGDLIPFAVAQHVDDDPSLLEAPGAQTLEDVGVHLMGGVRQVVKGAAAQSPEIICDPGSAYGEPHGGITSMHLMCGLDF